MGGPGHVEKLPQDVGSTRLVPSSTSRKKKKSDQVSDKVDAKREKRKIQKRNYYERNKEKYKDYYQKNKEKSKIYYERNKEKILKKNKERCERNKEKILKKNKE